MFCVSKISINILQKCVVLHPVLHSTHTVGGDADDLPYVNIKEIIKLRHHQPFKLEQSRRQRDYDQKSWLASWWGRDVSKHFLSEESEILVLLLTLLKAIAWGGEPQYI